MSIQKFTQANHGKLLKAKDVSELTSISRSHLHRLAREGKFKEAMNKLSELREKHPNDSELIYKKLQNEVQKSGSKHHPIVNQIVFERDMNKKAQMLYSVFGDDLVYIMSSKDKLKRKIFKQLRESGAINKESMNAYFKFASGKKKK